MLQLDKSRKESFRVSKLGIEHVFAYKCYKILQLSKNSLVSTGKNEPKQKIRNPNI